MSPIHDERFQGKRPEKALDPRKFSILRTPDTTAEPVRRNASPVAAVSSGDPRTRMSKARIMSEETGRPLTEDEAQRLWDAGAQQQREVHRRNIAAREERERTAAENRRRTEQEHEQRREEYLEQRNIALDLARMLQAQAVENELTQGQILSTCESYDLTEADVAAVGARLKAQGLERLPGSWDYEIRNYLEGKNVKHQST